MIIAPEVEGRPWSEQLALDDECYRVQLGYRFDRSAFYRDKLVAAGFASAQAGGGLADISQLPLTDKHELRATATPQNPFGPHLCASSSELLAVERLRPQAAVLTWGSLQRSEYRSKLVEH